MSLEGTIAAIIMLMVGVAWLALPILRRRYFPGVEQMAREKERDTLLTTYERTLASLRDVDEDHLTGKLADPDYEAERAYWTEQGAGVLQALEKLGVAKPTKHRKFEPQPISADAEADADADAMLDNAIEQTIASYIKSRH